MTHAEADAIVQQLRELPTPLPPTGRSDGTRDPGETLRDRLYRRLLELGQDALPSLTRGLGDVDVRLRKSVALSLLVLASGDGRASKLDVRGCLPALVTALRDADPDVRGWAAQSLGAIGPDAAPAVPALIRLLEGSEEGDRNSACIALGEIGGAAAGALPALRRAVADPRENVRRFAKSAIDDITGG